MSWNSKSPSEKSVDSEQTQETTSQSTTEVTDFGSNSDRGGGIRFNTDTVPGGETESEIQDRQDRETARILLEDDRTHASSTLERAESHLETFTKMNAPENSMSSAGESEAVASSTTQGWVDDLTEARDELQAEVDRIDDKLSSVSTAPHEELKEMIDSRTTTLTDSYDEDMSGDSGGSSGGSSGGCFLTTACVDARGLPDDCPELTALRAFRDGPLRASARGPALIERYYRVAPPLLARIEASEERSAVMEEIYAVVLEVVAHLGGARHEAATAAYEHLVLDLEQRFPAA